MNEMGALSLLSQCEKRGIGVRILTEINRRNTVEAEQLLRLAEVRHRNGILQGLRYIVVDGEQSEMGVTGLEAFDDPEDRHVALERPERLGPVASKPVRGSLEEIHRWEDEGR